MGEELPTSEEAFKYTALTSRSKLTMTFDPSLPMGTTVWFIARWVTRRFRESRSSEPVKARLREGVPLMSRTVGFVFARPFEPTIAA